MKEERLIFQLKRFKKLAPREETLALVKTKVFQEAFEVKKTSNLVTLFRQRAFVLAASLVVVLLVVGLLQRDLFANEFQSIFVKTQIALTANKFDKATLSFNLSKEKANEFETGQNLALQTNFLVATTNQTNFELSKLDLIGEKGKYTNKECLAIYAEYQSYLKKLQGTVDQKLSQTKDLQSKASLQNFKSEITKYQKEAKLRVELYQK